MRELLEKIEPRQQLVRETAGRLRDQIADLTEQLTVAEQTLSRLETTRAAILEMAAEDGTPPPEPLPAGYREIIALFEQAGEGLRARDVSWALGLGPEPRHTENSRATLKRLVARSILTEPEPSLFTLVKAAPDTHRPTKLKFDERPRNTHSELHAPHPCASCRYRGGSVEPVHQR